MRSFAGRRMRRPRLMAAAVASAVATAGLVAALVIALRARAEAVLPWVAIGGFVVFFGLMLASVMPRPATVEVSAGQVRTSWGAAIAVQRVEVGRWLMAAIDTPIGVLLEVVGADGARLRIGGEGHDGRGYVRDPSERAPVLARRSVDIAVPRDDLDGIALVLGVVRVPGELVVELVPNSQSARGALRTIGPWFATIAVVSALGVTAAMIGAGTTITSALIGVLVVAGLAWTIVRASRVRPPEITLQAGDHGLAMIDRTGTTSVPWSAVRAAPRIHIVRSKGSSWTMPALELTLGDRALAFCAWGGELDSAGWSSDVPRLRRVRWLAGPPQFASLLAELRRRGCITTPRAPS